MVREITKIVDESGFSHDLLIIEITESAYQKDQDLLRNVVNDFHANGFTVWMDDFGSGYSSLNDLQTMNFELLKMDMKFMQNFEPGSKNETIVRNIIDMAKKLGMQTLAEGVETEEQYTLLKSIGCEKIQGYYFSKPTPLVTILDAAKKTHNSFYEAFGSRSYLSSIGRLDLHNPFSDYQFAGSHEHRTEVPTGVFEISESGCRILSSNEAFASFLAELSPVRDVLQELWENPDFRHACKAARSSDGWEIVTLPSFHKSRISFRLHHIADNSADTWAVMAVVLAFESVSGEPVSIID